MPSFRWRNVKPPLSLPSPQSRTAPRLTDGKVIAMVLSPRVDFVAEWAEEEMGTSTEMEADWRRDEGKKQQQTSSVARGLVSLLHLRRCHIEIFIVSYSSIFMLFLSHSNPSTPLHFPTPVFTASPCQTDHLGKNNIAAELVVKPSNGHAMSSENKY
ncbi:hypothetical protein DPEC_G00279710 [Dallia pectoralis]|uniref:Uncharacterized protein n=1 Tax=Dallia pectoralis TaxID=75939 RepID=A0ACC2FMM1_DALPE|nr:hypothetical protein DPEC_G00279710 [Dallia pectoralis]